MNLKNLFAVSFSTSKMDFFYAALRSVAYRGKIKPFFYALSLVIVKQTINIFFFCKKREATKK
jgi:uncharacterized RDD family membrane protein YckC